jgi:hypothetical protein
MSEYVPELLNELTRIVLTTRNRNPSVEAYDSVVLPEWQRCEEIMKRVEERPGKVPTVAEQQAVYQSVLRMLRIKELPEEELLSRINEAFQRASQGVYPVDRRTVEAGGDGR